MGLDSVELIMEIEKAFDISIPDQEAEKLTTVEHLHDYVWSRLEHRSSTRCNSQILFYKLRRHFINKFGITRNAFIPGASLEDFFPQKNRREEYAAFSNNINLKLPSLALTKPWVKFLNTFGTAAIVGGGAVALFLIIFLHYSWWTMWIPLAGAILTLTVSGILNPYRLLIQPPTIKEYTERTLALNYALLTKEHGPNRKEVESVINLIIEDKIGVDPEEISPDKSFTDGLGVD